MAEIILVRTGLKIAIRLVTCLSMAKGSGSIGEQL